MLRKFSENASYVYYTIDSYSDLNSRNITNLFNTGDSNVAAGRVEAREIVIQIPQSIMFASGPGRLVDLGDFELIQALANNTITPAPGEYTALELATTYGLPLSFVMRNGLVDTTTADYASRAYIFQTQEYTLDQSSRITVYADGSFNVSSYEIQGYASADRLTGKTLLERIAELRAEGRLTRTGQLQRLSGEENWTLLEGKVNPQNDRARCACELLER